MKTNEEYSSKKTGLKLWIVAGGEKGPESGEERSRQFLGTLLHKAIELLLKYGMVPDSSGDIPDEILKNSIDAASALLQSEQYNLRYELDMDRVIGEAKDILSNTLGVLGKKLLLEKGSTVLTEVEVIDNRRRTLRVDLLRVNRGSNLVEIFDFKTRITTEDKAKLQVKQYISAVDQFFGSSRKIMGFIVYLDPPDIVEV